LQFIKAFIALRRHALTYAELAQKITELEGKFDNEFADINEVLKWLGEENQSRANEIIALQTKDESPVDEPPRPRIGFKK